VFGDGKLAGSESSQRKLTCPPPLSRCLFSFFLPSQASTEVLVSQTSSQYQASKVAPSQPTSPRSVR